LTDWADSIYDPYLSSKYPLFKRRKAPAIPIPTIIQIDRILSKKTRGTMSKTKKPRNSRNDFDFGFIFIMSA
jgi:hypothetical protein